MNEKNSKKGFLSLFKTILQLIQFFILVNFISIVLVLFFANLEVLKILLPNALKTGIDFLSTSDFVAAISIFLIDRIGVLFLIQLLVMSLKMAIDSNPFEEKVITKLKTVAWISIGITVAGLLFPLLLQFIFGENNSITIMRDYFKTGILYTYFNIATGFIILVITEIMISGNKLKEENDLTV